jgi:hypothetical protein
MEEEECQREESRSDEEYVHASGPSQSSAKPVNQDEQMIRMQE